MLHGPQPTILLIEADASLRRLITLGLEYRNMHVIEASSPGNLPSFETQQPSLVLLDIDGEVGGEQSLLSAAQAHPYLSTLPMIVLAWECALSENKFQKKQITCLTKPFDARALHNTIEQILLTKKEGVPSKKQEILLSTQNSSPAPSIWPLITAAGLLLAFIGPMIQIALTALGLLIVIAALLLWTLGTKSPQQKSLPIEMGKTYSTSLH